MMSPPRRVSSYLTFSPLPSEALAKEGLKLRSLTKTPKSAVIFCGTCCSSRNCGKTFLLGSMAPCVVPTFLTGNKCRHDRTDCYRLQNYNLSARYFNPDRITIHYFAQTQLFHSKKVIVPYFLTFADEKIS